MITRLTGDIRLIVRDAMKSLIWSGIALFFGVIGSLCLTAALLIWLSETFGLLIAFVCLGVLFMAACGIAAFVIAVNQRKISSRIEAMPSIKSVSWADPTIVVTALDVARVIGGRRLSIAVAGASIAFWLLRKATEKGASHRAARRPTREFRERE